jgi:16S rRNA (cytosine967-C5)-methyltransferase
MNKNSNPREAAYLALLAALRQERYMHESLEIWKRENHPTPRDYNLAQQLSYGSAQRGLTLDFIAQQATSKKKLSLKQKERALIHIALYQYYFLERLPIYAIADEMVKIAKKHCHRTFVNFLNAILRNLPKDLSIVPQEDSSQSLSIRYSYPEYYVKCLLNAYGLEKAKSIMDIENSAAQTMMRLRPNATISLDENFQTITSKPFPMFILKDSSKLSDFSSSKEVYIQNATPATLIGEIRQIRKETPKTILDLCAAPGGKLFAVHDLFPTADLYANDVSTEKLRRLEDNCRKYEIKAELSCGPGENYTSATKFDIIILDVPCSNTGVLNKRPEARWRLTQEHLKDLENIQLRLIQHAKELLAKEGQIWYMTCSIMKAENEDLIKKACREFSLKSVYEKLILPNSEGWDGGFATVLISI